MTTHQSYMEQRTFGSLDGLRAICILAVLWHHAHDGYTWWPATERGFLGVDLFFVLSGFLIVTLLLRERSKTGGVSLRNFYIRRLLRIFPVYYAVLLGLTAIYLVMGKTPTTSPEFFHDLPYALTYTSNWVPMLGFLSITWSLSAEEQFYLLWPPIERWLHGYVVPLLLVVLAISQVIHFGGADGIFAAMGLPAGEPAFLKQTTFTPICLGVLLAHALHRPDVFARIARILASRWVLFGAVAVVVGVASLPIVDLTGWPRLTLHLALMVVLGCVVVDEDNALARVLKWAPLVRMGALSYGIYLFHMLVRHPCAVALERLGLPPTTDAGQWALFVAMTAASTAVAAASHRWFESRFLALKHRFSA